MAKIKNSSNEVVYSEWHEIMYGATQGSCLGSLLFVIFCNNIYLLPLLGKLILFMDDMTLLECHKNRKFLEHTIQHDLKLLMDWFRGNKLSLNITKTVTINFWPTNNDNSQDLIVENIRIPRVHITKFLGVYLDEDLNWKFHANQVHIKLQNNKQLLNLAKNVLDVNILIKIYYAHVYSHLSYGLMVWGSMLNRSAIDDLFKMQKACIHLVIKKKKNAATDILFRENKILKLENMINMELVKFGYRLSRKDLPGPIQNIMNIRGGKKLHRYLTHNKTIPNIQSHKYTQFNNSYLCKGLSTLSMSNISIKGAKNLNICIKEYKKNVFSQY